MALFSGSRIKRRGDRFIIDLSADEQEMLKHYLQQLRELLLSNDDLLTRLFPPAYVQDPDRDQEYQQLMMGELLESRFAAIETVEATLSQREVDAATITQWMQAINSLRLVIGTSLDVSEDPVPLDRDDPNYGLMVVYEVLGLLLHDIVQALRHTLPPPNDDDLAPG